MSYMLAFIGMPGPVEMLELVWDESFTIFGIGASGVATATAQGA